VDRYPPGEEVEVLISRRGKLKTVRLTLGARPQQGWTLIKQMNQPEVNARRDVWLSIPDSK